MSGTFDLAARLDIPNLPNYLRQVESCIDATLGTERSKLTDAVHRLTKTRGKRLRPTLCIASALLSNKGINKSVVSVAAAAELIHIGSLVHDDIIDEATTRWGISTINAQEGPNTAILSGDFLFARACALAGSVSQTAGIIAAETIASLSIGESAELEDQYNTWRTEVQLEQALHDKTAALMAAACRLGGICTNQTKDQLEALTSFGSNFGMAFQLVDDVLDFISSDTLLGKPVGNDIKEGVYTLPLILSLKGSNRPFVEKELVKKSPSTVALAELLIEDGSISATLARVQEYNFSAEQALDTVFGKKSDNLARLPSAYLDWALSSLVTARYTNKITWLA